MWEAEILDKSRPLGYRALVDLFSIERASPHFVWSYSSPKRRDIFIKDHNLALRLYRHSIKNENDPFQHLEFALKHEGLNLLILKKVFEQLPPNELVRHVKKHPTSKYGRMLWFLYENLLGKTLAELPDAKPSWGGFVPLLDPEKYYVSAPIRSARHRVDNNLLGSFSFCPMVRKTRSLEQYESKKLDQMAHQFREKYPPDLFARALQYLYTKETLSSWEIEREKPTQSRLARFTELLRKAGALGPLSKEILVTLQKEIVDPRFALNDYRNFQNYIGEEPALNQLILHYISPRPQEVESLMQGLLECFERMSFSHCHPVITAAVLSFGLVFIHPFENGNGRLHRFLVHYALSRLEFTPKEIVFPISAAILRQPRLYDAALEMISKPLLKIISDYKVNDVGGMTVLQETADLYRFMDFTPFAEFLFDCVEKTIKTDFEQEISFLAKYDQVKAGIKEIIDMPDQKIDLFIRCVRQNNGTLSAKKRESYFAMLSDEEIKQMETVVALSN